MTTQGVVVLAEDDADLGRFMMLALQKRAGVTVRLVADGRLALAALADGPVDVLVTDIQMPGMTGLELVQQVKETHPDLAIVMMTAHATVEYAVAALRHQVDEFLVKPVAAAELVSKVRQLAERSVLRRATAARATSGPDGDHAATDYERSLLAELNSASREHQSLTAQMDRAAQVQRDLLPRQLPVVAGYEFAGVCVPSFAIGGDFYDWHPTPGGVEFTIADVMGKGIAAAIMTATVRAVMRGLVPGGSPAEAIATAASALLGDLERTGTFVTVLHGRLDADTGTIAYADAGHGLSLHVHADGSHVRLTSNDLPIGIMDGSGWAAQSLTLSPGDSLIAFSDGLFDLLGGELGVLDDVATMVHTSATCQEVVDRITRLANRDVLPDDLTLIVIRRDAVASSTSASGAPVVAMSSEQRA
ncbi:Response regulator receiver domain-containing protein [Nakamurella panacisegetis]|uniref:Response regulator receiver domain-containing protein n=1 Tax=Nakamurella panacisegetis TaxID=1090615 RepID=A0A1H0IR82_9ACTN|nr:SpoIIE family protein phosphatase [Nakamurella panacisegetis]SDO33954.1 Response regulator receiver domain-containing protein [Nakamurella panacisegetis]